MTSRPHNHRNGRAVRLVDATIDGTATADEVGDLDGLLQTDAQLRRHYRQVSELHANLRWMHRADEPAHVFSPSSRPASRGEVNVVRNDRRQPARARRKSAGWKSIVERMGSSTFVKAAMLFGLLAIICAAVVIPTSQRPAPDDPSSGEAIVARLGSDAGCVWSSPRPGLKLGSGLRVGERLVLEQGIARLEFRTGATVLVESPSTFELLSEKSLRLGRGTVAVRSSGPAKDFIVVSPNAAVKELGTSFAVHCDEKSATEVEVFEGAVEVFPENDPTKGRTVAMGTNVSVDRESENVALFASPPENNRFAPLLERLWQDIRVVVHSDEVDNKTSSVVAADFSDGPGPDAIDTFYGAHRGRGWLTPWVAAGNPTGEILYDDADFGRGDPCLRVHFGDSYERAIAREYGPRGKFDPEAPHIITWRWRLEGKPDDFGSGYNDRVAFYGNPFFRRNSWPTNSWLIGVASADEPSDRRRASNEWLQRERGFRPEEIEFASAPRRVIPKRWYFFDSREDGAAGSVFDKRNMVDTGMELKFGVIYHFAVAIYPQRQRYDAAIRDDQRTVVRTGLYFRDRAATDANVFHATVCADRPTDERSFTLDSVRIQPLEDLDIQGQLDYRSAAPMRGAP